MKAGDLIRMKDGRFGTILKGPYTYRFMYEEDYEMESHGMGHLAGVYGSAIDVLFTKTGTHKRLSLSERNFDVVSERSVESP